MAHKRMLLWDYTNTQSQPTGIDQLPFGQCNISSVSNWNAWTPPELKGRIPFWPMVRSLDEVNGDHWEWIQNSHAPVVLTFNEPERNGISPSQAASLWKYKIMSLKQQYGTKLCSPSCASDPAGQNWMKEFMSLIRDCPPDYVGVHYYGTDPNAAINFIADVHQQYHHDVIVTEIASISRSYPEVENFTVRLANWMDSTPWVFQYGFFGCMRRVADDFVSPEAQLMYPDGTFTPLMWKLVKEYPLAG